MLMQGPQPLGLNSQVGVYNMNYLILCKIY